MFANEKGSYSKTLEVSRENSNRSTTMLNTDFLLKAGNYVVNVTNFVTSTTPVLNLIEGPYFRIRRLGDTGESQADAELLYDTVDFTPTPYRTWLELARQMEVFFQGVTDKYNANRDPTDPNSNYDPFYAVSYLEGSGCVQFRLSRWFLNHWYIQVSEEIQGVLRFPKFLYGVRAVVYLNSNEYTSGDLYQDATGFVADYETNNVGDVTLIVNGEIPLSELDQRESIDVYSTFPMRSKVIMIEGKEEREHILFRLPYAEQHTFSSTSSFSNNTLVNDISMVKEDMEIGLIDLCERHAETLHQLLLPGKIRNVQLRIAVRYKTRAGIVEKDFDFTNGFWYLRLLFVKKV